MNIVVSLNAGIALNKTVKSILEQDIEDYEIIIKDGGSTDGSIENLPDNKRIHIIQQEDSGIYDAMNQATEFVKGDYIIFMNCGDTFYEKDCIRKIQYNILKNNNSKIIYYGNCFTVNRKAINYYPTIFDDYICFSKTLCHQATVYPTEIFSKRKYQLQYKICSDFEYYVNAYCNGYQLQHLPIVIANYEGGGTSETEINRKKAIMEKKIILKNNFSKKKYRKNWVKLQLHGKGICQWMAGSRYLYKIYSWIAGKFYRLRKNVNMI